MGFLDDLKKNLGFGAKDVQQHNEPQPGLELDARDTGGAPAPALAPTTRADTAEAAPETAPAATTPAATTPQDAAAREAAQQHAAEESAAAQQAAAQQAAAQQAAAQQAAAAQAAADAQVAAVAAQEADPAPPVAPAPADQLTGVSEVVVEAGDTLRGIAVQFSVDLDALIAANADTVPNPDVIYPGQVLRLP